MLRQTRALIKLLLYILLAVMIINTAGAASSWKILAPGIEYRQLRSNIIPPWSHLHAFRINPQKNQFLSILASELHRKHASVNVFLHSSHALLAINGGFFDHNYQPLGLRISTAKQTSPIKSISWWGIFYIKNGKAHISPATFRPNKQVEFAIQSGPRLLINRYIPPLKPGRAERSALGITREGQVIILITDNLPLSTTELAQFMRNTPLNCQHALNLDGGSSSQLQARINSFQLEVQGFSPVSDAIVIKKRK